MSKTLIVLSPRYLDHKPGFSHPESPRRLKAIMEGLETSGILNEESCMAIEPELATAEDLELVHRPDYIQMVKRVCQSGGRVLDLGDTQVSRESYDVARLAVGGTLKAVDKVIKAESKNAFAFVRPPGHHAGPYYAMGFCIFNNIALAAAHLLRDCGLERILILDIDAHHGNGTQETFYETSKVLYMSLHQDPRGFPGTGFIEETGNEEGAGYTVNIPLPFQSGDSVYWKAIKEVVVPIVSQYKPQFILVSAGFDGYHRDTVAGLSLSAFIYLRVFRVILDLSHEFCDDKAVAVLEGGYRPSFLRKAAVATVAQMAGLEYRISDRRPLLNLEVQRMALQIIEEVKRVQSSFWAL